MPTRIEAQVAPWNAGDVCIRESGKGSPPEVSFAAHPHGGPESLWFHFQIKLDVGETYSQVKLVLKHTDNMLGGGQPENMRPVVRYTNADWQRLGKGQVETLPDGRRQVWWMVGAPNPVLEVAYCYPYFLSDVVNLIQESGGVWHADTIGLSQAGRSLVRLSNGYGEIGSERPGLYLMARQHSSETPGSWVLDGFLREIATLEDQAPLVWCIPLANIDGVEQGDYGKDNFPYDLNRAWGEPPMRHETLVYQRDIQRWKQRCQPMLALDFHAPGACENPGIYCFIPNPDEYPEAHERVLRWTTAIRGHLEHAAEVFERVANYASRWETPSLGKYIFANQKIDGFTFETPYAMVGEHVLTRQDYQRAGSQIALGVLESLSSWCRFT